MVCLPPLVALGLVLVVVLLADEQKGAATYRGQLVYCAEGAGAANTSGLVVMNPVEPYNTTGEPDGGVRGWRTTSMAADIPQC